MSAFLTQVTLRGFHFEDFHLTMNLSGLTAVTDSRTVVGKAVSLDATAPNTAKLAEDGEVIIGRLASFENRAVEGIVVGAVEFKFSNLLPIKTGETVVIGNTVVGAGGGEVKAAVAADHTKNFVADIIGTNAVVVKL